MKMLKFCNKNRTYDAQNIILMKRIIQSVNKTKTKKKEAIKSCLNIFIDLS